MSSYEITPSNNPDLLTRASSRSPDNYVIFRSMTRVCLYQNARNVTQSCHRRDLSAVTMNGQRDKLVTGASTLKTGPPTYRSAVGARDRVLSDLCTVVLM